MSSEATRALNVERIGRVNELVLQFNPSGYHYLFFILKNQVFTTVLSNQSYSYLERVTHCILS